MLLVVVLVFPSSCQQIIAQPCIIDVALQKTFHTRGPRRCRKIRWGIIRAGIASHATVKHWRAVSVSEFLIRNEATNTGGVDFTNFDVVILDVLASLGG